MKIKKSIECPQCHGSGFKYKRHPKEFLTCPVCKGTGFITPRSNFQITNTSIPITSSSKQTTIAHDYIEAGRRSYRSGHYDEAIKHYKMAIKANKKNHFAFYNLGLAFEGKKMVDEAIKAYKEAIELKKDFPWSYNNLAALLFSIDKHSQALEYAEKSIKIDDSLPNPYLIIGNVHYSRKNFDEAYSYYMKALKKDPTFFPGLIQAGLTKLYQEEPAISIKHLKKAVSTVPSNAIAWNYLAIACRENDELESAISSLTNALKLFPGNCMLLETFARTYLKMNEYEKAKRIVAKIRETDPYYKIGADLQEKLA
ncbi:MAG: tetratricopeptide repeat protein, partial [Candidatus Hodarchaeales archaeon]